ncbi:hypothetical protein F2Q69_00009702 [Brassica cretica]|uniref:XRRM domain-containing protein n=1 Tax=Brassica cretica TaxID=69181 RepID=A0A8S9NYH1_BRACR|nr:hypothetical protein F2Q69_00009702 [Brassica cretica]
MDVKVSNFQTVQSDSPTKNGEREEKGALATHKDNKEVVLREDLKAVFGKFGDVKFVDFKMGAETGYLRFDEPEASQKARAAAVLAKEGGLSVKNFIAVLEPLTGEAEKEYWGLLRSKDKGGRGGRGGKRGGGGRFGRKRGCDSPGGRWNKAQKAYYDPKGTDFASLAKMKAPTNLPQDGGHVALQDDPPKGNGLPKRGGKRGGGGRFGRKRGSDSPGGRWNKAQKVEA